MVRHSVLLAGTNVFVCFWEITPYLTVHISSWNRLVRGSRFFVGKATFQNIQMISPPFHNIKDIQFHKYQSHGIGA